MTALMGKKATAAMVDLHPASVMRRVREGTFPRPVELGGGRIAFVKDEVEAWINARIEARNAAYKDERRRSSYLERGPQLTESASA